MARCHNQNRPNRHVCQPGRYSHHTESPIHGEQSSTMIDITKYLNLYFTQREMHISQNLFCALWRAGWLGRSRGFYCSSSSTAIQRKSWPTNPTIERGDPAARLSASYTNSRSRLGSKLKKARKHGCSRAGVSGNMVLLPW